MMSDWAMSLSKSTLGVSNSGFGFMSEMAVRLRPSMPFIRARATAEPIAPVPAIPTLWVMVGDLSF